MTNPKHAAGKAKPQLHLIPASALIPLARVMESGASKYGAYNWRGQPVTTTTYISAAQRHLVAYLDGEDTDPESGQSHLAHVAACAMILLDAVVTGNAENDRPPPGVAGAVLSSARAGINSETRWLRKLMEETGYPVETKSADDKTE